MKAYSLANFVIVCVALSAIFSVLSHVGLSWTTKTIPTDIYTLWSSLAVGAVAAGLLARNLNRDLLIPKTYLNYVLMGLAFTQLILTINYHLLTWNDRLVEKELVPSIVAFSTTVLTLTNFRNSKMQKLNTDRLLAQSPLVAELLTYLETQSTPEAESLSEKLQSLVVVRELDELPN